MQVIPVSLNKQQIKNNTTFGAKRIPNPQKLLPESNTMKVISSALASIGIAGIALQKESTDFANTFNKEIAKSELKNIEADTIAEVMEVAPILIDIILTDHNSKNKTRNLNNSTLKSLVETYYQDAELTENLLKEKDEKGDYKYTAHQINTLVKIKNDVPELYELARKNPSHIEKLIELKNKYDNDAPLYGVCDIIYWNEASKINPKFAEKLIKQKNSKGNSRFTGEQVKYMVENFDENDNFTSFLINAKYSIEKDEYHFTPEQIIELHQLVKEKLAQKLVKKLSEPISYINYYGDKTKSQLDADDVIDIVKNPDRKFVDMSKDFDYDKTFLLKIYTLLNGKIGEKELSEILSLKHEKYNYPVFYTQELIRMPELFTKKANDMLRSNWYLA